MSHIIKPLDAADLLACAMSLWRACENAESSALVRRAESSSGMVDLMEEVMRIALLFEEWISIHVDLDNLQECLCYLLRQKFGEVCLQTIDAAPLKPFSEAHCVRIARRLNLPLKNR